MPLSNPESKPSFIERTRSLLGIERGRSRWQYLGTGFVAAGVTTGIWSIVEAILVNPRSAMSTELSAIGLGFSGFNVRESRFPAINRALAAGLGFLNLGSTALLHSGNPDLMLPASFTLGAATITSMLQWGLQFSISNPPEEI